MTEEEALESTEAFARSVARKGIEEMRRGTSGMDLKKGSNPVGYFSTIHGAIAAVFKHGYDIGLCLGRAERSGDDQD